MAIFVELASGCIIFDCQSWHISHPNKLCYDRAMRFTFLALLQQEPTHGYGIKEAFEKTFGNLWPPLNMGQIYTALQGLEKDGYVKGRKVSQNRRRNKRVYKVTEAGEAALQAWAADTGPELNLKNEFYMKLILARATGLMDPITLIRDLRAKKLTALAQLNGSGLGLDETELLLLEGAVLHLKADLEWLEMCETYFLRGKS